MQFDKTVGWFFAALVSIGAVFTVITHSQHQLKEREVHQSQIDKSTTIFREIKTAYDSEEYSATYSIKETEVPENTKILPFRDEYVRAIRPDEELVPTIEGVLQSLDEIDPMHLQGCNRRYLYLMKPDLENRLDIFKRRLGSGPKNKETHMVDLDEAKSKQIGVKYPTVKIDLTPQKLKTITQKFTGHTLSPDQLMEIAENERLRINLELENLEDKISLLGLADSIDEFAAKKVFIESNASEIKKQFETLSSDLRGNFDGKFYDYGVKNANTTVKLKAHGFNALASYDIRGETVHLYHDQDHFDLKRLGFLAVHEGWPGHHFHFQVKHLEGLCPDEKGRLFSHEAWATYAEFLADDVGFFDDPARRLGWLDYRLVRVGRIYIDMMEIRDNLSKEELRVVWELYLPHRLHKFFEREYERVFPKYGPLRHQHLEYILGAQTLLTVKTELKKELGNSFDEKKFHHILLTGSNLNVTTLKDGILAAMALEGESPFSDGANENSSD